MDSNEIVDVFFSVPVERVSPFVGSFIAATLALKRSILQLRYIAYL